MYCHQCGKEIEDTAQFCPYCGAAQSTTNATHTYDTSYGTQQTTVVNENDKSNIGWAVLAFFIPIAGLVLFLVWRTEFPNKAKSCLHGLIAGVVVEVVLMCCAFSAFAGLASSSDDSFDSFFDEEYDQDIDTNFNWFVNEIVE